MNGIVRERQVAARLREDGWLIASRRHEGGPGDILAMDPEGIGHLIEVKATRRPWERFGPRDRAELLSVAGDYGIWPVLAHWPARGQLQMLYGPQEWPERKAAA